MNTRGREPYSGLAVHMHSARSNETLYQVVVEATRSAGATKLLMLLRLCISCTAGAPEVTGKCELHVEEAPPALAFNDGTFPPCVT